MKTNPCQTKSSVKEIRERFDSDVERFSNLETGQQTTIDAPLCLELITEAAYHVNPGAKSVLDIGCGAGNYTIKLLSKIPDLDCFLIDLSAPMLSKAKERIAVSTMGTVTTVQGDIRELNLEKESFDIIMAGAVFHHLRTEDEWYSVFRKVFEALKPGGSVWISDLVIHESENINKMFWSRYGNYLKELGGDDYRDKVLTYVEKEDSPRSVNFQLKMLEKAGFSRTEILHKNSCFAAFGAIK